MPEITARLTTALADRYKIESHLGEGGMAYVYYYVMPFIDGETLRDKHNRETHQRRRGFFRNHEQAGGNGAAFD